MPRCDTYAWIGNALMLHGHKLNPIFNTKFLVSVRLPETINGGRVSRATDMWHRSDLHTVHVYMYNELGLT